MKSLPWLSLILVKSDKIIFNKTRFFERNSASFKNTASNGIEQTSTRLEACERNPEKKPAEKAQLRRKHAMLQLDYKEKFPKRCCNSILYREKHSSVRERESFEREGINIRERNKLWLWLLTGQSLCFLYFLIFNIWTAVIESRL